MVVVPGLGVLIDTPGMREMGVLGEGEGLDSVFEEVARHALRCRFRDCRHEDEPGCAVIAAAEEGSIDPERLESYRRLVREADSARKRADPVEGANTKRRWKSIHKEKRALSKRR